MPITIRLPSGERRAITQERILIGRGARCPICLPEAEHLQEEHARLRKIADRWFVESRGEWLIRVGDAPPAKYGWLKTGDVIRLSQVGPDLVFEPAHEDVVLPGLESPEDAANWHPISPPLPSRDGSPRATPPPLPDQEVSRPSPSRTSRPPTTVSPAPPPLPSQPKPSRPAPPPLPAGPEIRTTPPPLPDKPSSAGSQFSPKLSGEKDQERFEVKPNARRNALLAAIGCTGFALVGFWMMASGEQPLAGFVALIFFGGGGLYAIPKLMRRSVSLVLDSEGIENQSVYGSAKIPWKDVEHIGLVSLHGTKLVGVRLGSYDRYLASMSEEMVEYMRKYGLPLMKGLTFLTSQLEAPPILGLWSALEGHSDPSDTLKDFGNVGSLAEGMIWSRQQFGYEITFGWTELDRSATNFVALLEQYKRIYDMGLEAG